MSNVFVGGFLALLGVSLLLDAVLPVPIPVFKIGIAILFVYMGVRTLSGKRGLQTGAGNFFSDTIDVPDSAQAGERSYSTFMGQHLLDLSKLEAAAKRIDVSIVFG